MNCIDAKALDVWKRCCEGTFPLLATHTTADSSEGPPSLERAVRQRDPCCVRKGCCRMAKLEPESHCPSRCRRRSRTPGWMSGEGSRQRCPRPPSNGGSKWLRCGMHGPSLQDPTLRIHPPHPKGSPCRLADTRPG